MLRYDSDGPAVRRALLSLESVSFLAKYKASGKATVQAVSKSSIRLTLMSTTPELGGPIYCLQGGSRQGALGRGKRLTQQIEPRSHLPPSWR